MTEPTPTDRIAALQLRRAQNSTEPPTADEAPSAPVKNSRPAVLKALTPSGTRLATAGASAVSFAAMVVAMGPLTAQPETFTEAPPAPATTLANTAPPPTAPKVVVEVIPNFVLPDDIALIDDGEPVDANTTGDIGGNPLTFPDSDSASSQSGANPAPAPAPTAAPAQAPKATAAPTPAPTAAPAAAPAATAPPAPAATAPPAPAPTAPAATAPPATNPPPPVTQAPPPRSEASG